MNNNNQGTPLSKIYDKYDAIIIGAGIGGLVCGCYLAKAGMKVLIVERNSKPGGYCVSFKRDGFTFDAGIHALSSCRKNGQIGKVLEELGLEKEITLTREKASDAIILHNTKIFFRSEIKHTIEDFKNFFPAESRNIEKFFNELTIYDYPLLYVKYKDTPLNALLSDYFSDAKLKFVFSRIIAGNSGLSSYQMAAFAGIVVLREFILDGGYYPLGGMQAFADIFYRLFIDCGGNILFSTKAEKIILTSKKISGVTLDNKIFISSKIVISNCDLIETFTKLLDISVIDKSYFNKINRLEPSTALFLVFLGLKKKIKTDDLACCGLWYSKTYDIEKNVKTVNGGINYSDPHLLISFPSFHDSKLAPHNSESVQLLIRAPFRNKVFWRKNKESVAYRVIKMAEDVIPDLEKNIKLKEIATPWTFYNYTLNHKGAMRGWASIVKQCRRGLISEETPIANLFLTGHWVTKESGQGGVPMVVRNGRNVARIIKKKYKNW